jgi:hypothetical protein
MQIDGYSLRFHEMLKQALEGAISIRKDDMANGMEERDYRQSVGFVEGLRAALAEAEEIRKKFSER